jgi:RNA polymerase sigma factor (sigma-70 family)
MAGFEHVELVRSALAGDRDAYGDLVERFRDAVVGLCYHRCGDPDLASDLAQEAFVRAYQNLGQLGDAARFPAWLRRIAERVCLDWRRGHHQTASLETAPRPQAMDLAEKAALRVMLESALAALPEAQRLAVTLFHINGYSYREIAAFLDAPETTVKARLDAARQSLRGALAETVQGVLRPEPKLAQFRKEVMMRVTEVQMKQGVDLEQGGPAAYLVLGNGDRAVPMQIGLAEGTAIRAALGKWQTPRPMTYDLMLNSWAAFGIRLTGVRVRGMDGTTILAELALTRGKSTKHIDCRPSDAANLALRADVPVEVDESVLTSIGIGADQARADYGNMPDYPAEEPGVPMHQAAANGDLGELDRLLDCGEDPNKRNQQGATPLRLAVMGGHANAVSLLVAKGADVADRDYGGRTALHFAAHFGSEDVVAALLAARADVGARDAAGATPLHVVCEPRMVEVLAANGSDLNAKDENGRTPLHYAASNGRLGVVEALLRLGADAATTDRTGATALGSAATEQLRQLLRRHGAKG